MVFGTLRSKKMKSNLIAKYTKLMNDCEQKVNNCTVILNEYDFEENQKLSDILDIYKEILTDLKESE